MLRVAEDLDAPAALRQSIGRHPLLAAGVGTSMGFVVSSIVMRASARMLTTTVCSAMAVVRLARSLPAVVVATLRAVRPG